jgi:hypothetical protein
MMRAMGLYKLGAVLLCTLLGIGALAYAVAPGERRAVAAERTDGGSPGERPLAQSAAASPGEVCTAVAPPRPLDREIRESSGAAVSRRHDGIFWTHNDSGEPLLYAVDAEGRTVGRVRVAGARVEDWEDIALAPCPSGGDCLYVADVGDNDAVRPSITLYRVPEPAPDAAESAPAEAIHLRYPDGPHDAEAMFVLDGAIHLVTKGESGPVAIYRAPASAAPGAETVLERIRQLTPDKVDRPERITGADASADGRWVVLRTLRAALLYPAAELAGSAAPRRVDLQALNEEQGEGIAFAPDGSLVVTSEGGGKKKPATFARLRCSLP